MNNIKENTFKNIVLCIRDWYESEYGTLENNDLSALKLFKLMFFICSRSEILLNIFEFHVMPYGHIEKDVYERFKRNSNFGFFTTNNTKTIFKSKNVDFPISYKINNEIITQIGFIKSREPLFIKASSSDLIDLNQSMYSYKKYYNIAKSQNKFVQLCPKEEILQDNKSYYIKQLHLWYK